MPTATAFIAFSSAAEGTTELPVKWTRATLGRDAGSKTTLSSPLSAGASLPATVTGEFLAVRTS